MAWPSVLRCLSTSNVKHNTVKPSYQNTPILWQPNPQDGPRSYMALFIQYVNERYSLRVNTYAMLHQWSIADPAAFWHALCDFCQVIISTPPTQIMSRGKKMRETMWFTGAKLNFAENLLRVRDQHTALIFASERGGDCVRMNYSQLYAKVSALAAYLRTLGVGVHDRVVGCLPNIPETVIAMLATTSLGAVWSSCSPDFGVSTLLDRFGQIKPVVLFAVESHTYKGKTFHHLEKIRELQQRLPTLRHTILIPYIDQNPDIRALSHTSLYSECFTENHQSLHFEQLPFNHPLYILYSSGTTGKPKCMVHGAGGTLLQHLKELMLHTNVFPSDPIFFNTTCGWMMWNWLISSLAIGATVILYDGSPFYPTPTALFDLIDKFNIRIFGIGAKFFESIEKQGLEPKKTHHLSELRTILTTGSPLLPESFDYVYQKIKTDIRLSSISGGSDIISCFALGNPLLPVYRGELQCLGLGMDVKIFNETGQAVIGEKGELVCTTPFPSMPIYFWDDPDGEKYQKAYFDRFPHVWAHGDYAEITPYGGVIIYGRSDTVLKPKGIRIGTAEIYRQIEKVHEVLDCLAVGQRWENDERIILFIVLRKDIALTEALIQKIKNTLKEGASANHVPAKIIAVPDLPRTINEKLAETAVKNIIHHQPVKNKEALANPESLDYFKDLEELKH